MINLSTNNDFDLVLALDSATRCLSFALGGNKYKVIHIETDKDFRYAETIVLQMDRLLKDSGLSLDQVDCVACGIGPGSFTGLRVGLAAIKALMMSRDLSCFTISTLDLIVQNALGKIGEKTPFVRVIADARRSRYYTAEFRWVESGLQKQGSDEILSLEEILPRIRKGTALLGDGIATFKTLTSDVQLADIDYLPDSTWYPQASEIISLLMKNSPLLTKVGIRQLQPAYLRPTEPEQRLMESFKARNNG